jgi:hypothetical protein
LESNVLPRQWRQSKGQPRDGTWASHYGSFGSFSPEKNYYFCERKKESKMDCKYTAKLPVDEWGRLGGLYSLADVPIMNYTELTRDGTILSRDKESELYEVKDEEKGFTMVVEFNNVELKPTSPYAT